MLYYSVFVLRNLFCAEAFLLHFRNNLSYYEVWLHEET